MAEEAVRRLGRGLAALIGEVGEDTAAERGRGARQVPVEFLRPNPRNPRKRFGEGELAALGASIRQRGIVQPIVARAIPGLPDAYEIVAGERRWRAAQAIGLHEVPVVVVDVDDRTSLEYAILENVQRTDLNAIEEAGGYQRLMEEFGYNQTELASVVGKSRPHVNNMLRLLSLPDEVKQLVMDNRITGGHARALLAVKDPVKIAQRILDKNLSVREVEEIAYRDHGNVEPVQRWRREKDPDTRALERALEDVLGLAVSIEHREKGGEIRFKYKTLEQLDGLCRRLRHVA
ncbi:MAG TPA: ParB/RepB/Spo0J family partition protein [Beijerinckiaceae bacterium]|nr:ParB/RepB/Spo0J family partition protein [Beijerinckiaceae bacterium]